MQVRDAMTKDCKQVAAAESLRTAASRMRDEDIGMLLVQGKDGAIAGILTDRDITVRGVAAGADPEQSVDCCLTEDLVKCADSDSLQDAARLMEQEQVRRLLVVDTNGRPAGVLAQADIARALGRSELVGEALQEISQPGGDHTQH